MPELIIYRVTNTITNECYIGQTSNGLHNRKVDHIYEAFKRGLKDKFHTAMRKYGLESFTWEQIAIAKDRKALVRLENHYIRQHNSIENGYNTQIRQDLRKTKASRNQSS